MENTAGFYNWTGEEMQFSPTSVYFPDGTALVADIRDEFTYPHNGWSWYDSAEEAYAAAGVPMPGTVVE